MMRGPEIIAKLATLPTSMYKGKPVAKILENITYAESVRYLMELSILNEKEKSRLDVISDKNSDEEESIYQNQSMVNSPSLSAQLQSSIQNPDINEEAKNNIQLSYE